MNDQADRWRRLGQAITDRMRRANLSQAELVRLSGLSDATIRALTRGEPRGTPRPNVLGKLSTALHWPEDACDLILAGADPEVFNDPPTEDVIQAMVYSLADRLGSLEDDLALLRRSVARLEIGARPSSQVRRQAGLSAPRDRQ